MTTTVLIQRVPRSSRTQRHLELLTIQFFVVECQFFHLHHILDNHLRLSEKQAWLHRRQLRQPQPQPPSPLVKTEGGRCRLYEHSRWPTRWRWWRHPTMPRWIVLLTLETVEDSHSSPVEMIARERLIRERRRRPQTEQAFMTWTTRYPYSVAVASPWGRWAEATSPPLPITCTITTPRTTSAVLLQCLRWPRPKTKKRPRPKLRKRRRNVKFRSKPEESLAKSSVHTFGFQVPVLWVSVR